MRDIRDMETFAASQNVMEEIYAERRRQVDTEGWTPDHDAEHADGALARAAASYALQSTTYPKMKGDTVPAFWPWDLHWWKPTTPRRDLIKAAALIVAEVERMDRHAALAVRSDA